METFKNLIAGDWVSGSSAMLNRNPSDLAGVGEFAQAAVEETRQAVAEAKAAFPAWSTSSIQERSNILDRAGSEILARKDELGQLRAREEGKTLPEATGEVMRAGQMSKFFAGEARFGGEKLPSVRPGVEVDVTREPIGVGIITPWNFPIAIPSWQIAPALVFGNTVVFKPAQLVPGCGWALTDILVRAGVPAGVFSLVMGSGKLVGETLVNHPDIAGISFTGSVETGRAMHTRPFREWRKFSWRWAARILCLYLMMPTFPRRSTRQYRERSSLRANAAPLRRG